MLEISQLQTILAVAKTGSFSRAAEELHVTQSAISQSVKNMETRLNVALFRRTGKKILLTNEGQKVYDLAAEFLKKMDQTLESVYHAKDDLVGKVRVGTLTGVGKSWVAPELMNFSQKYENIKVIIKLGFSEELIRDFENNDLDFVILPENYLPETGEKCFFSSEKATLVFPKNGPFNINPKIDLETMTSLPTIFFEQKDHLYMKWCQEHFGKKPENVNVRLVVNVHGNILHAVSLGLGIAVVPLHVLSRSFYKDKVETLGDKFEIENYHFYVVYHKDSLSLKRMQCMLNHLQSFNNPLGKAYEL